jgi:DNA-binding transcriptional LysR family regulator
MRELKLDQLRTLVTVVELGSFTLAARALHLSQPTVSLHVAELEKRLEQPLLVRGFRQLTATPAGDELVRRARRLLREADDAVEAVGRLRADARARLRIGASTGGLSRMLPAVMRELSAVWPHTQLELRTGRSPELLDWLAAGSVDLVLVAEREALPDTVVALPWHRTPLVALLPQAWQAPAQVTPAWLAARPLIVNEPATHIHGQVMGWFAQAGLQPTVRLEMPFEEVAAGLVGAGYGAALLPARPDWTRVSDTLHVRPLRPALQRSVVVCHRKAEDPDSLALQVAAAICGLQPAD